MTKTKLSWTWLFVLLGAFCLAAPASHAQVKLKFRFISNADIGDEKYELRLSWLTNDGDISDFNFANPPWQLAGTLKHEQTVEVPRQLYGHQRGISIKAEVIDTKTGRKVAGWDTLPESGRGRSAFFQGSEMRRDVKETGLYSFFYMGGDRLGMEFEWKQEALW